MSQIHVISIIIIDKWYTHGSQFAAFVSRVHTRSMYFKWIFSLLPTSKAAASG